MLSKVHNIEISLPPQILVEHLKRKRLMKHTQQRNDARTEWSYSCTWNPRAYILNPWKYKMLWVMFRMINYLTEENRPVCSNIESNLYQQTRPAVGSNMESDLYQQTIGLYWVSMHIEPLI